MKKQRLIRHKGWLVILLFFITACNTREKSLVKYGDHKTIGWVAVNNDSSFFKNDTVCMYEMRHKNELGDFDDNPLSLPAFKGKEYIDFYFRNKETFSYEFSDSMNGVAYVGNPYTYKNDTLVLNFRDERQLRFKVESVGIYSSTCIFDNRTVESRYLTLRRVQ